jgi:hypothetical protein
VVDRRVMAAVWGPGGPGQLATTLVMLDPQVSGVSEITAVDCRRRCRVSTAAWRAKWGFCSRCDELLACRRCSIDRLPTMANAPETNA